MEIFSERKYLKDLLKFDEQLEQKFESLEQHFLEWLEVKNCFVSVLIFVSGVLDLRRLRMLTAASPNRFD